MSDKWRHWRLFGKGLELCANVGTHSEFQSSNGVGPKQLCALANLGYTAKLTFDQIIVCLFVFVDAFFRRKLGIPNGI